MAIYKFLTTKDLELGMKTYFRNQVIGTETQILTISEAAAFDILKAKLSSRYDLTKLFPSIKDWAGTTAYLKDEYSYKGDKIYRALLDGTNQDPATATTYWVEDDPRIQLLVKFCVSITIYFMVESLNPNKINDEISNNFTNAMEWLEACQKQEENPDWPLLEAGSTNINWGSNKKLDHYW